MTGRAELAEVYDGDRAASCVYPTLSKQEHRSCSLSAGLFDEARLQRLGSWMNLAICENKVLNVVKVCSLHVLSGSTSWIVTTILEGELAQ
jgi:hypothetical protein